MTTEEQADDGEEKKTDDTVVEDLGQVFQKITTAPLKRFSMALQCPSACMTISMIAARLSQFTS
jgi:hypothetical protein